MGTFRSSNGSLFVGQWRRDLRWGRGKTTAGKATFEGSYREGTREGSGSLRIAEPPNPVTFFGMFDVNGAVTPNPKP